MKYSITRRVLLYAAMMASHVAAGEPQLHALDKSFGDNGDGRQIVDSINASAGAYAIAIDGKNRILLAGSARDAEDRQRGALVRLNQHGKLDGQFAHNLAPVPVGGQWSVFNGVATDVDGSVVAAGAVFDVDGVCDGQCWLVCKLTTAGEYETSFGDGSLPGCASVAGLRGGAYAVAVQSDGRILVSGSFSDESGGQAAILRYESNGNLDLNFGDGGIARAPDQFYSTGVFTSLHVATDGTIAATGQYDGSAKHMFVARFDSSGKPMPSFAGGARVVPFTQLPEGDQVSIARFVRVMDDGSVLVGGTTRTTAFDGINTRPALVKLDANGIGVQEFGMPGLLPGQRIIDPCKTSPCSFTSRMFYMENGSIQVAGQVTYSQFEIRKAYTLRLHPSGEIDPSFADGDGTFAPGVATAWWPEAEFAAATMQQGKIVLAGTVAEGGENKFAAIRFGNGVLFADGFDKD